MEGQAQAGVVISRGGVGRIKKILQLLTGFVVKLCSEQRRSKQESQLPGPVELDVLSATVVPNLKFFSGILFFWQI